MLVQSRTCQFSDLRKCLVIDEKKMRLGRKVTSHCPWFSSVVIFQRLRHPRRRYCRHHHFHVITTVIILIIFVVVVIIFFSYLSFISGRFYRFVRGDLISEDSLTSIRSLRRNGSGEGKKEGRKESRKERSKQASKHLCKQANNRGRSQARKLGGRQAAKQEDLKEG